MSDLTHRVAAAVYIFRDDRVLLLKRVAPPQTLAPPGGRLEIGEDPLHGALREVQEETGLTPEIFGVAQTWFGVYANGASPILCINYLATCDSSELHLSNEHSAFVWATKYEIEAGHIRTQDEYGHGYRAHSFVEAFEKYEAWTAIAKR
ncbi:MAG: NUDIX hydrolase [bacterium]|nr:NUDIX hydrolase [bacterium]